MRLLAAIIILSLVIQVATIIWIAGQVPALTIVDCPMKLAPPHKRKWLVSL
jgi:hypothetical protein